MFFLVTRRRFQQLEARLDAIATEMQNTAASAASANAQATRAATLAEAANGKAVAANLVAQRALDVARGTIDLVMPTPPHLTKEEPTDG